MQLTLEMGAERLDIRWPDGTEGQFPYIWLRDTDPAGFHPLTGERAFDLTSVPLDIAPTSAEVDGADLLLQWPEQTQASRFALDWLWTHRPGVGRADPADLVPTLWRAEAGAAGVPRVSAKAMADSEDVFASWLRVTKQYGLSIIEGLADDTGAGKEIGRRIGHLRETNFGLGFEVETKPDPNNLAYTADALPLHTDLPNQEVPPGFQFLHCLANEAKGGGSTFCDGRAVAEDLRRTDPEAFAVLTTVTVPFRFHDAQTDLRSRKPVIVLDEKGAVSEICFNAHLADILDLPADQMIEFYRAYRVFMQMMRGDEYTISLKLNAGEMVVFNNRAVLHGRASFDPSTGYRHLHGFYVDRGEWDSRLRVMARA
ncbi:TauD/TfdA family dioxygenase [Cognatishimia sp. WU-CL00825]|uniref:TauD/TfdA family dioxygenase n=1 Tax=Cognatishimia sp. WU-CL00825 TaxID=3127658 RepID=UPI003106CE9C